MARELPYGVRITYDKEWNDALIERLENATSATYELADDTSGETLPISEGTQSEGELLDSDPLEDGEIVEEDGEILNEDRLSAIGYGSDDSISPNCGKNCFTVMDENIPAPDEIISDDTIEMPEIQTMPGYIRRHYEKDIIEALRWKIIAGDLCICLNGRRLWNAADSNNRIVPGKGAISWMGFRRINDFYVEADLVIEVEVNIVPQKMEPQEAALRENTAKSMGARELSPQNGGRYKAEHPSNISSSKRHVQKYRADMWFDMEDEIEGDFGNLRIYRWEDDKPGIKLDDYLVPVLGWDGVEKESERIVFETVAEGLNDPRWLNPGLFTDKMGLKVVRLPLHKRPKTSSILFFSDGQVLADEDWLHDGEPEHEVEYSPKVKKVPIPVPIKANTIVLNGYKGCSCEDDIFHECFHYKEHRLFFLLQKMHTSDISRLAKWKSVAVKKETRSPLEWMEWQANVGSQCLRMPRTLFKQRIEEELTKINARLPIWCRLQSVGRILAKEFGVYNYQARNRMIHVGYWQANGILNYVDGEYIAPFGFSREECRSPQTFVITPTEMLEEYVRNEKFRELLDSGRYIYADGHVCINDSDHVVRRGKKMRLRPEALAEVHTCCLRFVRTYQRDKITHYVYGQLNSDEEYNGRSLTLAMSDMDNSAYNSAKDAAQTLMALPGSFHGSLTELMKKFGIKRKDLVENSGYGESTVDRYCRKERDDYTADAVAVLCVALHFDPIYSFDLMQKAGIYLRNTPEDLMLKAVLMGLYNASVSDVRGYLASIGYKRVTEWPKCQ